MASEERLTPFVKLLTVFAAIGGFLFGYDTGVVSGALILLKNEFQLSTVWQELFVSVTIAAAAVAAVLGGPLNGVLGRRPVIIIASTTFTAGAVVLAFAPDKELLIVGRIVIGLGVGFASMTVPLYIAELSPPHLRGKLVTINNLFITGGQFVASVVDGAFSYFSWGWRCMLGLAAIPSLIQLIGFMFFPESPRWLILKGDLEKAREAMISIYGPDDYLGPYESYVQSVRNEMNEDEESKRDETLILRILKTPAVRKALFVGCCMQILQQFGGINTIMYYSASIIRMSGVEDDTTVIWMACIVSFTNFIFTIVGLYFVERIGRRKLSLGSMIGVMLCEVFLALSFLLIARTSPNVTEEIPSTDPDALYCGSVHTCDSCILHKTCGFCYNMNASSDTLESYCLPVSASAMNQSTLGPCSSASITKSHHWAYDYCPSPVSILALVGLILYLVFFAPGMGCMPWVINSEIYPGWARSLCNSIATTFNWLCNLLVSMTFLSLTEVLTRFGTFTLYAIICFIGVIFIYCCLPETKGLPLEEVTALFADPLFSVSRSRARKSQYEPIQDHPSQENLVDEEENRASQF